jgi:hypothetical protein
MSVKFEVSVEGDYISIGNNKNWGKNIINDPTIQVTIDKMGLLKYIDIEICLSKNYYTNYVAEVVNSLIPGEYSVEEFGWSDVSAAELFVLLLLKGYNTTEYTDWADALPDKGERLKSYLAG